MHFLYFTVVLIAFIAPSASLSISSSPSVTELGKTTITTATTKYTTITVTRSTHSVTPSRTKSHNSSYKSGGHKTSRPQKPTSRATERARTSSSLSASMSHIYRPNHKTQTDTIQTLHTFPTSSSVYENPQSSSTRGPTSPANSEFVSGASKDKVSIVGFSSVIACFIMRALYMWL